MAKAIKINLDFSMFLPNNFTPEGECERGIHLDLCGLYFGFGCFYQHPIWVDLKWKGIVLIDLADGLARERLGISGIR